MRGLLVARRTRLCGSGSPPPEQLAGSGVVAEDNPTLLLAVDRGSAVAGGPHEERSFGSVRVHRRWDVDAATAQDGTRMPQPGNRCPPEHRGNLARASV